MDVIKTRLQTGAEKHQGIISCAKYIHKSYGLNGFFKGLTPRVLIVSVISKIF